MVLRLSGRICYRVSGGSIEWCDAVWRYKCSSLAVERCECLRGGAD